MPYYLTPAGSLIFGLIIFLILYYYRKSLKMTSFIYDVFQMFFGAFTATSGALWGKEIVRFITFTSPINMLSTLIIYFFVILGLMVGVKSYKPKLVESLSDPLKRTLLLFFISFSASFIFLYITNYINYVAYVMDIEPTMDLFTSLLIFGTISGVVGALVTDILSG